MSDSPLEEARRCWNRLADDWPSRSGPTETVIVG